MNDRQNSEALPPFLKASPLRLLETLSEQARIRLQYGPEFIGDLNAIAVGLTPRSCVYEEGAMRLYAYAPLTDKPGDGAGGAPLLLIYSLINRPYIFDLRPKRSLIEYFCQQGYTVYLLDWGDPTPEMGQASLGDLVTGTLRRCTRRIQRLHRQTRIPVLGYCMGATFASLYAAYRPQDIERLILLTPMLGHTPDGTLQKISASQQLSPELMHGQLISGRQLKMFFNAVKPAGMLKKERDFWQNYDSDIFLEHFLPVEKWGNDTPDIPGKVFQELIQRVIREGQLQQGQLNLDGKALDMAAITCPVLAVAAQHDWIIPASALQVGASVFTQAEYTPYLLKGGHIGLVVGRSAATLWQDLQAFLQGQTVTSPVALSG